jgi:hypothetical protein
MPERTAMANAANLKYGLVEHVCAHQKPRMRLFVRTFGIKRDEAKTTLDNLAYNMNRLIFHERMDALDRRARKTGNPEKRGNMARPGYRPRRNSGLRPESLRSGSQSTWPAPTPYRSSLRRVILGGRPNQTRHLKSDWLRTIPHYSPNDYPRLALTSGTPSSFLPSSLHQAP